MKNSERFAEASAYADNAFAKALGVSPALVGFAMLGLDLAETINEDGTPLLSGDEDYRKTQLWEIEPVSDARLDTLLAGERKARVDELAAKYSGFVQDFASNPKAEGEYEHPISSPIEFTLNLIEVLKTNSLGLPSFVLDMATDMHSIEEGE